MKRLSRWWPVAAILFIAFASSQTAFAQATRTWVSGVGDDANPCSRTAPCKTFAGAISKTADGGIINCLDPGGYGSVTITKSIVIDCTSTFAGVLASGVQGIVINAPATAVVTLRGVQIEGQGTTLGTNGINFFQGAALHVENCRIDSFSNTGIMFQPNSTAELFVSDSTIVNTGTGTSGAGISIRPTGGAGKATIRHVELKNNANGLNVDASAGAAYVHTQVVDSLASGSAQWGFVAGGGLNSLFIDRSTITFNASAGVVASGSSSQVIVSNSTISDNGVGVSIMNGANGYTYLTNNINANATDGSLPSTLSQH